ncbi:hypothetical protein [Haloglomus salinum]|uniref:hypothetical protein n=1 Tax=Haloglomus salinum TaxID=2962673 RepID=UPI0020C9467F|nr:hypothetical protein [Haloglomus salinum]
MRRREMLAAAGTAAAAGLAGCLGLGPCASAPDEPRRIETTVRNERRVTLSHDGCPTLRDPAPHDTTVENQRTEPATVAVGIDRRDGGALFRGTFRLRTDATVTVERPEPAAYAVTVRVPALDWRERYTATPDSYDCNEHWQGVTIDTGGVESRELATTMGCETGPF